jgi:hypothetical protein
MMMSGGFQEPAACESFNAECPGVLDEVGDATEVLPEMGGDSGAGGTGGSGGSGGSVSAGGCTDTCRDSGDGACDDGGEGSDFDICELGTDCSDCGPRP